MQTVPCIQFTTLLVNQTFLDRILHAVVCRTVIISQSLVATRLANWHFHCQISQILHFSKAFGSENNRMALSGEKHLAAVIEISKIWRVISKPCKCNGKTISRTKKTSRERAHR